MIIKKGDIFISTKDIYLIYPKHELYNKLFEKFGEKKDFISFISIEGNNYEEEEKLKYLYQLNKNKYLIQIQGKKILKSLLKNFSNLKYKKIIEKNNKLLPFEFIFSRFVKIYEENISTGKFEKDEWDNIIFNYSQNNQQKFSIKKNELIIFLKLKNLNNNQEIVLRDINLSNFKIDKNCNLKNLLEGVNHKQNNELKFSL